ncbi:hypothetical protein PR048_010689 [Dryococelus australis]|uniref:Uncharacterized protein n=1 Tax=Dryococelus australis TaxID=614101 RepID=A0ABQ9I4K6_9NEOP|nr:hypothetical protein PR048_010689 [Dryococelus australis]
MEYFGESCINSYSENLNNTWIETLLPLRYHIEEIYNAVYEDSQDMKINAFDRNTVSGIAM